MNPPKVVVKDFYLGLADFPCFGRRSDLSEVRPGNDSSAEPFRVPYSEASAGMDEKDRITETMEAFTSQKIRNHW